MILCIMVWSLLKAIRNFLAMKNPAPIARIRRTTTRFLLKTIKKFLAPNFDPTAKYFDHLTLVHQWNGQISSCIRADVLTLAKFRGLRVRRARYMRNSEANPQSGYIIFDVYAETGLFALLRVERKPDPSVAILTTQRARQESEPQISGPNGTNGAEVKDFDFPINDHLRLVRGIGDGKVVYELTFKESSGPGLDNLLAILGAIPAVSAQHWGRTIYLASRVTWHPTAALALDDLVLSMKAWMTGIDSAGGHSVMIQQPSRRTIHYIINFWGEMTVDIVLPYFAVASHMKKLNAELEEAEEHRRRAIA
ncbi:hypothetical protein BD779DRAFT_1801243 [Infundibulicybe gibba]|nr:hypothetical protein BD779DRAFT_1801243 [Infundibulicybe gibba]